MKLKKFFALALAAATLALALTACGSKADDSADNSDANTDNQSGETVTVKLGVVGGIYDDLWASAKAALADEGIDLEIVQFSDYVTPNNALASTAFISRTRSTTTAMRSRTSATPSSSR